MAKCVSLFKYQKMRNVTGSIIVVVIDLRSCSFHSIPLVLSYNFPFYGAKTIYSLNAQEFCRLPLIFVCWCCCLFPVYLSSYLLPAIHIFIVLPLLLLLLLLSLVHLPSNCCLFYICIILYFGLRCCCHTLHLRFRQRYHCRCHRVATTAWEFHYRIITTTTTTCDMQ